jgi:adenine phosphoribosyltransferase
VHARGGRRIAAVGRIGVGSAGTSSSTASAWSALATVTVTSVDDLRAKIREVPDFPKPGILFYDITTLLKEPDAFREVIDRMADQVGDTPVDVVVGMESRGFIFSAPLAYKLGAGFVPVRKLGKLPAETIEVEYELEYGTATLEIHADAISSGQRVLIVDDLLATGGTVMGTIELVRRLGGEIAGLSFMVELGALKGRERLDEFEIHALLTY